MSGAVDLFTGPSAEPVPSAIQTVPSPSQPDSERPVPRPALRRLFVVVGVLSALAAVLVSGMADVTPGEVVVEQSLVRTVCLIAAGLYLCGLGLLSSWYKRMSRVTNALTLHGSDGTGWAIGWILVPVIAAPISFVAAERGAHNGWLFAGYLLLGMVRTSMVSSMASRLARAAPRSNCRVKMTGMVMTWADVTFIAVGTYGIVRIDGQRDWLVTLAASGFFAILAVAFMYHLYMKRVERGMLDCWDSKFDNSDARAAELMENIDFGAQPTRFSTRRLFPIAPFRFLVVLSYWAVAAAALWNGRQIWTLRNELTFSSDPQGTFDQLVQAVLIFAAAIFAMQFVQGMWSIGQAWNAQRCTLQAPHPLGMAILFLIGPIAVVFALAVQSEARFVLVVMALLVNMVCWGFSFGILGRTIESLGRSSAPIKAWGTALSAHWLLSFASRPFGALDDLNYAKAVVAVSILDAAIFVFASIVAWKAMVDFEDATREHEQILRL